MDDNEWEFTIMVATSAFGLFLILGFFLFR
jgi:hypothetical protein